MTVLSARTTEQDKEGIHVGYAGGCGNRLLHFEQRSILRESSLLSIPGSRFEPYCRDGNAQNARLFRVPPLREDLRRLATAPH